MKQLLAIVGLFVILVLAITLFKVATTFSTVKPHGITATLGGQHLSLLVANTDLLRAKGLSGIEKLNVDEGMLFVFSKEGKYGFWMKDMKISLDILWIDRDLKIIGVEKNVSPLTYPQAFYPPDNILYVLELPVGTFDRLNLQITDPLLLESQNTSN